MNQLPFIVAAYAVTVVILGGLVLASFADFRRHKRLLATRAASRDDAR
jgi:heme exporter protein CcmD